MQAIRAALESDGVEFTNGDEPGVKLSDRVLRVASAHDVGRAYVAGENGASALGQGRGAGGSLAPDPASSRTRACGQQSRRPAHPRRAGTLADEADANGPLEVITGAQIRQARELLGWPPTRLAQRAKVHSAIVRRAESVEGEPPVTCTRPPSFETPWSVRCRGH